MTDDRANLCMAVNKSVSRQWRDTKEDTSVSKHMALLHDQNDDHL
jgi:hypothetical protein